MMRILLTSTCFKQGERIDGDELKTTVFGEYCE